MISTAISKYPEILKKIWLPILKLLLFFHQIFKMLILLTSINIFKIWWKKGNNFKMGNQIYFKIAG
jgi:hypothetical protein